MINVPKFSAKILANSVYTDMSLISLSITKRSGTSSYYYITSPFIQSVSDILSTYPSAVIQIMKNGVLYDYFNFDYYDYAIGPYSSTISVRGYRQYTNTSPTSITLSNSGINLKSRDTNGRLTFDVVPFLYDIEPADTAIYGIVSKVVSDVQLTLNESSVSQTITLVA